MTDKSQTVTMTEELLHDLLRAAFNSGYKARNERCAVEIEHRGYYNCKKVDINQWSKPYLELLRYSAEIKYQR